VRRKPERINGFPLAQPELPRARARLRLSHHHDGCLGRTGLRQCRGGGTLPAAPGCTAACLPLALSTGPARPQVPGAGLPGPAAAIMPVTVTVTVTV